MLINLESAILHIRIMTRVRTCLLYSLLVSSLLPTLGNTRGRQSTSTSKSGKHGVADSVFHVAGPGFVKTLFMKPPLSDVLGGTTNISTTRDSDCATGRKSEDTLPRLSSFTYVNRRLSSPTCSPALYRVTLSYGDCFRPVLTQRFHHDWKIYC